MTTMHVIHGTWIPDAKSEFVRPGAFYLWVETDAPPCAVSGDGEVRVHPRHLAAGDLEAFLKEKLGLQDTFLEKVSSGFGSKYFSLPTGPAGPLPSFELLRYVEDEIPDEFDLAVWQVCCYRVPNPIATLNDLHFAALHAADGFQLGTDLMFWYQFSRVLKQVIAKDQYIPTLKYHALPSSQDKPKAKPGSLERHAGWEILSDVYESAVRRYVASMPAACVAGFATPEATGFYSKEGLLRHFSECLLNEIVTSVPFPARFDQQVADTLIYDCLYPYRPGSRSSQTGLTEYRQWAGWRQKLTQAQTAAGFNLCFRLADAPTNQPDEWRLHFLVAAKHDPSLKLSLDDYWSLPAKSRSEAARPFGADFEKNLLLGLGYAARVYPKIWEGLETAEPTGFRLSLDEAFGFLKESAWVLEDSGYTVIVPAWWTPEGRRRARVRLKTSLRPAAKKASAASTGYFNQDSIISYQYQLSIGGELVSEAEWRQLVAAKTPLVQFRGQWLELDREKMLQMLEFWQKRQGPEAELTLQDIMRIGSEAEDDLEWDHDQTLELMLSQLQDKSAFAPIADPANLNGSLRDYQKRGVAWLRYLESLGLNPCLADDMGLGKTLEVIAHLVAEQNETKHLAPTLVIAPTSVVGNWRKEIERFAPTLSALVHHGSGRMKKDAEFHRACQEADVVITSFALARLDEKLLRGIQWRRVVVDEAQNIKNPQSAQARAVAKLPAQHRLALTGTPVENRLLDLWSIFNFLNPGYLGKEAQFRKSFELPIQKNNDLDRSATLKKLVEPFILRRVKTDQRIIADLPDKIEQKVFCNLTPEQASLYAAVVKDVAEQLEASDGIQRRGIMLATLMKLKQICNHPTQFLQDGSVFSSERSHKLKRLGEMIEEAIESGESLLVFSQFAEIGRALEQYVAQTLRYQTYFLHGGTSLAKREKMIADFQDPETEPSVFILSLRAGGVGLNLTKANHVFHFDRWWNPAVEDQATDRAFRIGQSKNVFVHKFVAIGTVEERIDQLIEDKKRISTSIVGADESWLTELDNDTFKELIALQRSAVLE